MISSKTGSWFPLLFKPSNGPIVELSSRRTVKSSNCQIAKFSNCGIVRSSNWYRRFVKSSNWQNIKLSNRQNVTSSNHRDSSLCYNFENILQNLTNWRVVKNEKIWTGPCAEINHVTPSANAEKDFSDAITCLFCARITNTEGLECWIEYFLHSSCNFVEKQNKNKI